MKKVCTVAAHESRNVELKIGLDLGGRSSWYCVLDQRIGENSMGGGPPFRPMLAKGGAVRVH